MSSYDTFSLYPHNIAAYEKVKSQFSKSNVASIVHATGTGKSYIALQLVLENKEKNILYLVPNNSIIEHIKEIIEDASLDFDIDFPHLTFKTYQGLAFLSEEEIKNLNIDYLILDEFHHIGAPIWGAKVKQIIQTHPKMNIFGMTAYTVRDRGSSFERDMINPETEELFSNTTVSRYHLYDAILDSVLPKPVFKSAYFHIANLCEDLESKVEKLNHDSKQYKEYKNILVDIKRRVHEADEACELFKKNIKPNGKYIYFCPYTCEYERNDIASIVGEVKTWLSYSNIKDYELYTTTSNMGIIGKQNRDAFYNDKDISGNDVSNKLRIMFAINQYNEGVHAPGLDGVILGRSTHSDIVFFEQLGRALSVKDNQKEYQKLKKLDKNTLYQMCVKKDIKNIENLKKEELIEVLLSPIIIDLAGNLKYIKELQDNIKNKEKEIYEKKDGIRNIKLGTTDFKIDLVNEDLFHILEDLKRRLTLTWEDYYELAKTYFEHYGNLSIPPQFKTFDGVNEDEYGIALGSWIIRQYQRYNGISGLPLKEAQIDLLSEIGMIWGSRREISWEEKYTLAKTYFNHHGNLNMSSRFKTKDGITYDEDGIGLGSWITQTRFLYNHARHILKEEQINLLSNIGMNWDKQKTTKTNNDSWKNYYELAKAYFEHYGNLSVPRWFKTFDGVNEDENGVFLGSWIMRQYQRYNGIYGLPLKEEQIDLLSNIGMIWDSRRGTSWNEKYKLAKSYFEHYGNLNIQANFRTNDGINYDKNGVKLGQWLFQLRYRYNNSNHPLKQEQIELLSDIGMIWSSRRESSWDEKYKLAKSYFEHYGNLNIQVNFRTKDGIHYDENGYELGEWIARMRHSYNNPNISLKEEKIQRLSDIGMIWTKERKIKARKDSWEEYYKLCKSYFKHYGNLNVPKSFITKDGFTYDKDGIKLGKWIIQIRYNYNNSTLSLSEEQVRLLLDIGMHFSKRKEYGWEERYKLAKSYFEYYGNLKIATKFRTKDGITYDEDGIRLGEWIQQLRHSYNNPNISLEEDKIQLLNDIGMIWDNQRKLKVKKYISSWEEYYKLAKSYFESHGDLNIPSRFITKDGITYDENGVRLGEWIIRMRHLYNNLTSSLSKEYIQLLSDIGMVWDTKKEVVWQQNYELAKKYFDHYGNLNMSSRFVTKDGITYDEDGIRLGSWLTNLRCHYNHSKTSLSKEQMRLLKEIGMSFYNQIEENWLAKYELAASYFNHYGNLNIPTQFKTKDGINYDENGYGLGNWISQLRHTCKSDKPLSDEKIKLLQEIGMNFDNQRDGKWQEKYALAKTYFNHHGNLNMSSRFITKDGITYDEDGFKLGAWVLSQRKRYTGKITPVLTQAEVKQLEDINISWYQKKSDLDVQKEIITEKNLLIKQRELLHRCYSLLNQYNEDELPSKEELNDTFIKVLKKGSN